MSAMGEFDSAAITTCIASPEWLRGRSVMARAGAGLSGDLCNHRVR